LKSKKNPTSGKKPEAQRGRGPGEGDSGRATSYPGPNKGRAGPPDPNANLRGKGEKGGCEQIGRRWGAKGVERGGKERKGKNIVREKKT